MHRSPVTRCRVRDYLLEFSQPVARLRQRTAAKRSPQTFEDAPGDGGDGASCAIERWSNV